MYVNIKTNKQKINQYYYNKKKLLRISLKKIYWPVDISHFSINKCTIYQQVLAVIQTSLE